MAKITRDWLVKRIDNPKDFIYSDEALEAFKIALKSMDSEPVAYYANDAYYNTRKAAIKDGAEEVIELYDVVPYEKESLKCTLPRTWVDTDNDEVIFASEVRNLLDSLGIEFWERE